MKTGCLVYAAPVPSASFPQRPHAFVNYVLACGIEMVLWVEPYPTRFPSLRDVRRFADGSQAHSKPAVVSVRTYALPLEPLPLINAVNSPAFWLTKQKLFKLMAGFERRALVIGKPSAFAEGLLRQIRWDYTVYDAMDHFPNFYSGLARRRIGRIEVKIVERVDSTIAASHSIAERLRGAEVVLNGHDPGAVRPPCVTQSSRRPVLGYVGTLGRWFDWDLVVNIATQVPDMDIHLIGPLGVSPPRVLPENVHLRGEKTHKEAMQEASGFTAGLIPFIVNDLTAGVDPIKYYEYQTLGLPVITTPFGEFAWRGNEEGVFLIQAPEQIEPTVRRAVAWKVAGACINLKVPSWRMRFSGSRTIQSLITLLGGAQ